MIGVDYAEFLAEPQAVMAGLAAELGVAWDVELPAALPYSKTTYSRPSPDKWRRLEAQIEAVWPIVEAADAKAAAFLESVRR